MSRLARKKNPPVSGAMEEAEYIGLRLMTEARALADQGKTVVMVVHDLSHAMQNGDHLLLMKDGGIVACGTPEAVFQSGAIDDVFDVKLHRTPTPTGWQYYCTDG